MQGFDGGEAESARAGRDGMGVDLWRWKTLLLQDAPTRDDECPVLWNHRGRRMRGERRLSDCWLSGVNRNPG